MEIKGFDRETMKKFFISLLTNKPEIKFATPKKVRRFSTRTVHHSSKGDIANATSEEMAASNIEFKHAMAFLYIKTFYGKSDNHFKTMAYKNEREKFNRRLYSSPNHVSLIMRIKDCLYKNSIDAEDYAFLESILYDELENVNLSMDNSENTNIFFKPEPKFPSQVRIYINPSQKDYGHFVEFLFTEAAKQELCLRAKTRQDKIGVDESLDNLVLYTTNKDFIKIIGILHEYGRRYPDKVAEFGGLLEGLCRTDYEWFGLGFEPQRGTGTNVSTFNSFVDDIFNSYIFPAVIFNSFDELTTGISNKALIPAFALMFGKGGEAEELALDFIITMRDKTKREKFLFDFCNLSKVLATSNSYNEENKSLSQKELNGLSPLQARPGTQKRDEVLLMKEKINIQLNSGKIIEITREQISEILKSPLLRNILTAYYSQNPEKIGVEIDKMMALWANIGKSFPYLDNNFPYLSCDMVKELENAGIIKPTTPPSRIF